ncbi:PREDICTED: LOC110766272, partial [Prunus dulcis]
MTEIKNNTAVEVEIREVERGDVSVGRLVAKMPPAGRNLIRAKKFLDHSSYTGVPRTVHVIATANGVLGVSHTLHGYTHEFAENRMEFVEMGFKLVNFVLDKIVFHGFCS